MDEWDQLGTEDNIIQKRVSPDREIMVEWDQLGTEDDIIQTECHQTGRSWLSETS